MEPDKLHLKFGTALFTFKDKAQMKAFLENYCFKDSKGRIILHHGTQIHDFTELCTMYYSRLPPDLKFVKRKRTAFMNGCVIEKDNNQIINLHETENN